MPANAARQAFGVVCAERSVVCLSNAVMQVAVQVTVTEFLRRATKVFKQFVIEADVRLGPYAQCNPDPSTGVYNCSHWFGSKGCWYNGAALKSNTNNIDKQQTRTISITQAN